MPRTLFALLLLLFPVAALASEPIAGAEAAHQKGIAAASAGNWPTAVEAFETAAAAAPNDLLLGTDYRQAVIQAAKVAASPAPYDRSIAFFEKLVAANPKAPNALLNLGFATVDRIPVEGSITQVILADKALGYFGKAIEIEPTWLALYSRGHAYLYWPAIFGRADAGIADLERAVSIAKAQGAKKPYYARTWAALGDGYWRKDDLPRAREAWKEGLALYPEDADLKARTSKTERTDLDALLNVHYDTTARVSTSLAEIYGSRFPAASK